MYCFNGDMVFTAGYSIVGGALSHIAVDKGTWYGTSLPITITGTPAFSGPFVIVGGTSSNLVYFLNTFTGSATGQRYSVTNGGHISTAGGGASYLPGNSAGSGTNFGTSPYGLYT